MDVNLGGKCSFEKILTYLFRISFLKYHEIYKKHIHLNTCIKAFKSLLHKEIAWLDVERWRESLQIVVNLVFTWETASSDSIRISFVCHRKQWLQMRETSHNLWILKLQVASHIKHGNMNRCRSSSFPVWPGNNTHKPRLIFSNQICVFSQDFPLSVFSVSISFAQLDGEIPVCVNSYNTSVRFW